MSTILHQLFPEGIETTAQRQLKRLPEMMHPLLMAAAVAGTKIDAALMSQLINQLGYPFHLDEWLVQTVSAAILEMDQGQSRFADEALRLALVDTLSEPERIRWHEQIATALELVCVDNLAYAAVLAYHWQQVGNVKKEQQYARLAGGYAYQQYEYDTAVHYLTRAFTLTAEAELAEQYHLLLARERIYHIQGDRDAQKDDLTQLAELADLLLAESGQEWRTEVALRLGTFAEATGEYTAAIVAATEALRLAKSTQTPAHEAASHLLWGQALLRQGKYEETKEKLQMSQMQARQHHLPHIEADSLRFSGVCAADMGQFDQARESYEAALVLYHDLQDKRGESAVLNNLSIVSYSQNQLVTAMEYWEQARLIHESIGDKEGTARVLSNLSSVCMDLGEYEQGRAFSQKALTICRETDLRFGQGMNLINLSLFNLFLQDEPQAEILSLAALDLAQEMESVPLEGLALKDRAYLLAHQQRWAEAAQVYGQALAIWQEVSQPLQMLEAHAGLAKVACGQGDLAQAQEYLQPVLAHLQAGHSLQGTSRPFYIYLVCYEVLAAKNDSEAATLLQQAHDALTLLAEKIDDETRQHAFWHNVHEHRQIHLLVHQGNN